MLQCSCAHQCSWKLGSDRFSKAVGVAAYSHLSREFFFILTTTFNLLFVTICTDTDQIQCDLPDL